MITGITAGTFDKLQLNAGVFLTNFEYDSATDAAGLKELIATAITSGNYLGATRGGGSFECTPDIRNIEADGKRYEFVGSSVNDGWTVRLTATLLEATPDTFAKALAATETTVNGNVTTLQIRTDIKDSDYLPNLCWVGDTSDGGAVLIELDNALNTTGATFTFADKGEGTLPVEFVAHQASLTDTDYAPCKIVFFGKAASA